MPATMAEWPEVQG